MAVRQLLDAGGDRAWVRRRVASGRWQRLLPGVVLTHSGPILWGARGWSAVLYAGDGAALSHASAARALGLSRVEPRVVEVAVPAHRRVVAQPGLRVGYRSTMPGVTRLGLPSVDLADTVVDLVATARSTDDAVGWLCEAVRGGLDPAAVLDAAARRRRLRRRGLLAELVGEALAGVESPLELRYGRDVERRHGLPRSELQARERVGGRWIRADRRYAGLGVRAELDGALAHPSGRTDLDTWRDNEVLVTTGEITLRFRWRHVVAEPCESALLVARALRSRAWTGLPTPCSPICAVRRGPAPRA